MSAICAGHMTDTERGHNWILMFFKVEKAIQCAKDLEGEEYIDYIAVIKVEEEKMAHFEVLLLCNALVSKESLEEYKCVVIKQYGIDYDVYKNVMTDQEPLYEYGTPPVKETDPEKMWIKLEDSFRNDEGDTQSYYYQRFAHHFDEIITESKRLKRCKTTFGNNTKLKNVFIFGGDELRRMEKVNEITHGHSVYMKKTDKYWDRYRNEEYIVIEHPSYTSFKRIFKYIAEWADAKAFEGRTRHKRFQINPNTYRLIIVTEWSPHDIETDDDLSDFLNHFTLLNLNE